MLDHDKLAQDDEEQNGITFTEEQLRAINQTAQDELSDGETIKYPILNFFRGSVSSDRLHHESKSQTGALAHWRCNTSQQRDCDEQILHAGLDGRRNYDRDLQRNASSYGASNSPGMGLESENLFSFITRSRQNVIPMPVELELWPKTSSEAEEVDQSAESGENAESEGHPMPVDLPSGAPAPAIMFKFRRMKTTTFTNLLARALNQ
jgi:hypothetical protein